MVEKRVSLNYDKILVYIMLIQKHNQNLKSLTNLFYIRRCVSSPYPNQAIKSFHVRKSHKNPSSRQTNPSVQGNIRSISYSESVTVV